MKPMRDEHGFTLVELLVGIFLFSMISAGFYSVMFSGVRAADDSEEIVRVSEEARIALARMIRDTREGQLFASLEPDSYEVRVDFDADGTFENPNESGDYESLRFEYNGATEQLLINGEVLAAGVVPLTGPAIFSYTSNDLQYDWNNNGETTFDELAQAPSRGYPEVDPNDPARYDNVRFAFRIVVGDKSTEFMGQAQLRNRR